MIWYITFAVVLLLLILAVRLLLIKRLGTLRVTFMLILFLVATYLIYIPIYLENYRPIPALFGNLLNVMQVISLDADYLASYDLIMSRITPDTIAGFYFFVLGLLHTLLPIFSLITAFALLLKFFTNLKISLINADKRPLYIFSQINERSIALAEDIRRAQKKCRIIFAGCNDKDSYSETEKLLDCVITEEDINRLRITFKENRSSHFFCISDDDDLNLNHALSLIDSLKDKSKNAQQNNHIYLFSCMPDVDVMIDSTQKGFTDIQVINENELLIYDLLDRYPLYRYAKDGKINVLLCGNGSILESALRTVLWCGQLDGYTLQVDVVGEKAAAMQSKMLALFPALSCDRYHIRYSSYSDELSFTNAINGIDAPTYVMVCNEDDICTIHQAIHLRRACYRKDADYSAVPPILCHIKSDDKFELLRSLRTSETNEARRVSYDLVPFGGIKNLYTYQNLVNSDIESLSRNVHLVYEDIFSDTEIDVTGALERYNLFEVNKRSNRANAMHIRYKLALLGLDYTEDENAEEVDLAPYLTEGTLARLTYAEHDRWMAFLETEGWVTASLEDVDKYKRSGISKGRHNCQMLKMHPYICPFEDLKACSDALGLPDSTVYDRELIVRIPDILHDRWNVSGRKYKIIATDSNMEE
ncbi:MAG: hypothetical protein IJC58_00810 [Oscillospiraceae bacterium]|nr:hypothetical protein [Oscillospiraceae bacterium]